MKKEASIKNNLMKSILNSNFLRENLLEQDYEINNENYLHETKIPNIMKIFINVEKIEAILFTKDDKNTMDLLIKDYQIEASFEKRIFKFIMYFSNVSLLTETLKQNYLQTKILIYRDSRVERYEDHISRNIQIKFDNIDLFYNCDILLSTSKDINDLVLISKYFKDRT